MTNIPGQVSDAGTRTVSLLPHQVTCDVLELLRPGAHTQSPQRYVEIVKKNRKQKTASFGARPRHNAKFTCTRFCAFEFRHTISGRREAP